MINRLICWLKGHDYVPCYGTCTRCEAMHPVGIAFSETLDIALLIINKLKAPK